MFCRNWVFRATSHIWLHISVLTDAAKIWIIQIHIFHLTLIFHKDPNFGSFISNGQWENPMDQLQNPPMKWFLRGKNQILCKSMPQRLRLLKSLVNPNLTSHNKILNFWVFQILPHLSQFFSNLSIFKTISSISP